MASSRVEMLQGPLVGPLFKLAIPVALIGILQQMFNTADIFVLGRYVGGTALSAVGNNMPIIGVLVTLFIGISLGANVVIARYLGGRHYKEASEAIHTTILLALFVGLLFLVVGELLVTPLMEHMGVPLEVRDDAALYLRVFLLGMPGMVMYDFTAAIYRSYGNVRMPLIMLFLASVFNMIADLLVVYWGWGLLGVVSTTVLANYLCSGLLLYMLRWHGHGVLHIFFGAIHWNWADVKEILRIGVPAGVQGMVFNLANVIIQYAINSQGAEAMAATGVTLIFEFNTYPFVIAFGQAITTFTGQNYGAGNEKRCYDVVRYGTLLSIGFIVVLSLIAVLLAQPFLQFLDLDELTIAYGVDRVYMTIGLYFLCCVYESLSASMRGFGYSMAPAIAMTIGICGSRFLWLGTLYEAEPTFHMIMLMYPVSWLVADVMIGAMFFYMRRKRNIVMGGLRLVNF